MNNLMHIHHQWATRPADERFGDLDLFLAHLRGQQKRSRVYDIPLDGVKVSATEDGDIAVNGALVKASPTNWAFGQIASQAKAPAGYLRTLPAPLAAECIRTGLAAAAETSEAVRWMARDTDDEGTKTELVAATSVKYGRIFNADVAASVIELLPKLPTKFFNPSAYSPVTGKLEPSGLFGGDRDMAMLLINGGDATHVPVDDGKSELFRGFSVMNSEVGSRSLTISRFMFRKVCGNLIIWDASGVETLRICHTLSAPGRFDNEAIASIEGFANAGYDNMAETIRKAKAVALPIEQDDKVEWFRKQGFTGGEAKNAIAIAQDEEGQCESLWDAVNGLTAHARSFVYIDAKTDLEKRAGKLLKLAA